MPTRRRGLSAALALAAAPMLPALAARAGSAQRVPVLTYHRFAPEAVDSMTLRLDHFEAHLRVIESRQARVVPLADVAAWVRGERDTLPPRALAITADDGHRSQFERMAPMLKPLGWPVTLFIYPSAISNADYAMRWEQLAQLQAEGPYRIESHTVWHPNFLRERARQSEAQFRRFAAEQLQRSRELLQRRLGTPVSLLAWPFGLSDEGVEDQAREAGYRAAFSLGNRNLVRGDAPYRLPRFLVTDAMGPRQLDHLLAAAFDTP